MLKVDCSKLDGDTKVAFASALTEDLSGRGIALPTGNDLAIDQLGGKLSPDDVKIVVEGFSSGRKAASSYSVEADGKTIVVHSTKPVSADQTEVRDKLPPNVFQCPVCGFVAGSQEEYEYHLRMHDYIRGIPG